MKDIDIPKTISGRQLSTESSKKDKIERYKFYLIDGFITSLFFLPFDILGKRDHIFMLKSTVISYIIDLIIRALIFFIINFLWGEFNVWSYNKYYQSLEDD